jgi:D-xylulose kinase
MGECFIGIDCGTQGTKAVVFDAEAGKITGEGSAQHSLMEERAGMKEQDPEEWIKACTDAVRAALQDADAEQGQVKAMGVSGQQHGFVPLDREGNVIRPAKLWCDTETEPQNTELIVKLGGMDKVIGLIGQSLAVGYTASKVLWLRQNEPLSYKKLEKILLPHDYINFRLTGEIKCEHGDASGTGYMDIRKREWCREMLEVMDPERDLRELLPPFMQACECAGTLTKSAAQELGLDTDVLVSSGGGDNMMAAIGTGAVKPGVVTASLGTSGTLFCFSDKPVVDTQGDIAGFCSSTGGWMPLICTMNVTVATELMRDLFRLSIEDINALAEKARPGSGGVLLVPYFSGERTPAVPNGTASFHGLTAQNTSPENFCRAAMEGTGMGLRYGLEAFIRYGLAPEEIRLVGGGSKSRAWCGILASIFERRCVGLKIQEGAALGAALQAFWAWQHRQGQTMDISEITAKYVQPDEEFVFEPDSGNMTRYDKLYDLYKKVCKSVLPTYDQHRDFIKQAK